MNRFLVASIIEAIYVVFMLNYFKTKYSFAHPLSNFDNSYFKHPIGISPEPISNICEFGHNMSWVLALFILLRICVTKNKIMKHVSTIVLIIVATVSLLNINAVIYLIPYFIYEIVVIKNNFRV